MDGIGDVPMRARRAAVARAARRRLVGHVAAGCVTDMAGEVLSNDASAYVDPDRFALERREIFETMPLVAGLSRDIPEPGDVMLFEELGRSIIVARGHDGVVRAFLNMCTHRGTRLIGRQSVDGRVRRRTLICPFHAWCFDLDGRMVARPGEAGFADLPARDLVALPAFERFGLIFVALSANAASIDGHLGDLGAELAFLEMARLSPLRGGSLDAACNWKLAIDTYAESYHFGVLHASTIGRTHFGNVATFDAFGPHWRLHFAEKELAALVGAPESCWPEPAFAAAHLIFPNTILVASIDDDTAMVRLFRIFPGDTPTRTTCRIAVYGTPGTAMTEPAQGFVDEARNVVTEEDYEVAIGAQRNLTAAPDGFRVVYGRNEPALQAFHQSVAAAIGVPGPDRAA